MGKLVLGIGVVILLQISFSIYMGMAERTGLTSDVSRSSDVRPAADQKTVTVAQSSAPLVLEQSEEPSAEPPRLRENSLTQIAARRGSRRPGFESRDFERVYRSSSRRRTAPAFRRETVAVTEPLLRQEFFGGMMVETKYVAPANRGRNVPMPKSRREVFGRMTVEYKFEV